MELRAEGPGDLLFFCASGLPAKGDGGAGADGGRRKAARRGTARTPGEFNFLPL